MNTDHILRKIEGLQEYLETLPSASIEERSESESAEVLPDLLSRLEDLKFGIQALENRTRNGRERLEYREIAESTVFRAMVQQVLVYNARGILIDANPACFAVCGPHILGKDMQSIIDHLAVEGDDGRTLTLEALPSYRALAGEFVNNESLKIVDIQGRTRHILVTASPITQDEEVIGAVVVWQDITELKEAEKTLQYRFELEKLVATLSTKFINMPSDAVDAEIERSIGSIGRFAGADRSYIFLLSPDRSTMDNTHEWCNTGIEPQKDRLQDLPLSAFPWWMARLNRFEEISISRVENLPTEAHAEKRILQKQGIKSAVVVPMVYRHSLVGFFGFDSVREEKVWAEEDITLLRIVSEVFSVALEHKRAEEALRNYADHLKRSNEDLERFAYVASHDLQEPLRAIMSYTQLLERRYHGRLDADADEYIRFIVEGSSRMYSLINDLLEFSRISTRGRPFTGTDATRIVGETLQNLKPSIQGCGASITHDPLPVVNVDASQIQQVFQNLIANALKFRREATPHIHISAERDGCLWKFSVTDNGIGIEPQYFNRIFVIFQRLHTREKYEGTGIGLALCKRIVERHGGRIWVESVVGKGTTFHFTLPAPEV